MLGVAGVYKHQLKSGTFVTPVRLDQNEEEDIWTFMHTFEVIPNGLQAFYGMAFTNPPIVKMPNLGLKAGEEMDILLRTDGERWRREGHKRLKAFGIVPYFCKPVNEDFVPIIPPVGSGWIETYYDYDDLEQKYLWFWKNQSTPEPAMGIEWIVEHPPTLAGKFTSPAKSLLMTWKDLKLVRENAQRVDHINSHLPIFVEKNPPKNRPGEDALTSMSFGDVEEGFVDEELHEREARKQIMERSALEKALLYAYSKNTGSDVANMLRPPLWSEQELDRQKREGNLWYGRSVILPDHCKAVQLQGLKQTRDPMPILAWLSQWGGALVDFPIEMLASQHSRTKDNSEMTLRYANERINDVLTRWEGYYKTMLLQCYGRRFKAQQKSLQRKVILSRRKAMTRKELLELSQLFDVTVEMKYTPLTTMEQVEQLWRNGVINQETYAKRATNLIKLPEGDIDIAKQELVYPGTVQELKMKQKYAPKKDQGIGSKRSASGAPSSSSGSDPKPKKKKVTPSTTSQ